MDAQRERAIQEKRVMQAIDDYLAGKITRRQLRYAQKMFRQYSRKREYERKHGQ